MPLHLATLKRGTTAEQLHAALERALCRRALRSRHAAARRGGARPTATSTSRRATTRNRVDLFVFASETQALLMCRLDNLGKGASGAAVQSMNVHLGLDEGDRAL